MSNTGSAKDSVMQQQLKSILLDHYHCTFFFPLMPTPDNPWPEVFAPNIEAEVYAAGQQHPNDDRDNPCEAQSYHFFSPILRKVLFQQKKEIDKNQLQPMQEWRLPGNTFEDWRLTLGEPSQKSDPLSFQTTRFKAITLYKYFNGIYLLAFRVEPEVLDELKTTAHCPLFTADAPQFYEAEQHPEAYSKLQLEAWLRFTRLGRQLYGSFTEQLTENKIAPICVNNPTTTGGELCIAFSEKISLALPTKPGEGISPIVRFLTKQFFSTKHHENLTRWFDHNDGTYDDRMFVSVAYGLSGGPHENAILNRIKTLVALTDRVDDTWTKDFRDYPYNPQITDAYIKEHEFALWGSDGKHHGKGSYYYFTDMVNAYLANGGNADNCWFFREVIAKCHIPTIYDRMLIQALFYQASLRYYDHQLTHDTQKLLDDKNPQGLDAIKQHRHHFIRFTNQYWFRELTQQMQGKLICQLQQKGLELDSHYEQLLDEISRTDEYLQAKREIEMAVTAEKSTKRAEKLENWGIGLALFALYLTLLPVLNDMFKEEKSFWQQLRCGLENWGLGHELQVVLLIALFLIAPGGLLYHRFKNRSNVIKK